MFDHRPLAVGGECRPANLLTFDIEDYYHLIYRNLLKKSVEPSRVVETNTEQILAILGRHQVQATFFIVGRVARRFPQLVKAIANAGHEIASHGYEHVYVNRIGPERFRDDLKKSKEILEDTTGVKVLGFRAPAFSIDRSTPWAFDILSELGFRYDSSLFPVKTARYGVADMPQGAHCIQIENGTILEVPLSTVTIMNRRVPVAGGGYLRVFPLAFNLWAIRQINREGRPAVVYMHPYEFEISPRALDYSSVGLGNRFSAYLNHRKQLVNRRDSAAKLDRLLQTFSFQTVSSQFVNDYQAADDVCRN
jgi:polysaccharide deacetylase family protein (PEP-CTERM system associated)